MEAILLAITIGCMLGIMYFQTTAPFMIVYLGAAMLYTGLLLNALH